MFSTSIRPAPYCVCGYSRSVAVICRTLRTLARESSGWSCKACAMAQVTCAAASPLIAAACVGGENPYPRRLKTTGGRPLRTLGESPSPYQDYRHQNADHRSVARHLYHRIPLSPHSLSLEEDDVGTLCSHLLSLSRPVNRLSAPLEDNWQGHQGSIDQKRQLVRIMIYIMLSYDI
jgi:hypothetical protein